MKESARLTIHLGEMDKDAIFGLYLDADARGKPYSQFCKAISDSLKIVPHDNGKSRLVIDLNDARRRLKLPPKLSIVN